ncbi:hypothetical protein KAU55_04290, partial [Candidatus Bathyarchaeota archaeon]|nr:hypothetical protein [Candidatus Bathyarchaeota archaeon]
GTGFYYPLLSTHPESFGTFAKPMANPYPYDSGNITLRPNGPGTYTIWQAEPLTPFNWECVNEKTANGDNDYVFTWYDEMQDSYNVPNPGPKPGPIQKVKLTVYAKLALDQGQTADDKLTLKLVVNGNSYYGVTHTLGTTYQQYSSDWYTNPSTGNDWGWADLQNVEAGFTSVQVGDLPGEWRVTQIYLDVLYASAAVLKLESDVCPADGAPDFPLHDGTGYRYHDLDGDGVYDDPEERLEISFVIRSDHYHRNAWGEALTAEMEAVNIRVDARYGPPAVAYDWWFYQKGVHLYTGGWTFGVDPDHTVLWQSRYYWHPGFCYNTGYVNDPILDGASDHVQYANTFDEALMYCYIFQDRFAEIAAAVPWWSYSGAKAVRRRYTGGTNEVAQGDGEDPYRGNYWDGIVNRPGYSTDDYYSFLNMHPRGFERGNCSDMTIRWGFKVAELKSFNPVFSEWRWEWNILGLIYDSLLYRSPYDNNQIKTNMASDYQIGTYEHPVYGTCTKIKYTLRPDITWADGMPVTTADVMFTLVEIDDILLSRGFPPPWWYSSVDSILAFSILDAYTFEVFLDVKSVYAVMWSGGNVVLPKHIWKPICEGPAPANYAADPNMIGCGPWRFQEYVGFSHVLLQKNSPGSTVTTNHPGSVPTISTFGYFRYREIQYQTVLFDGTTDRKFDVGTKEVNVTIANKYLGGPQTVNISITIAGTPYLYPLTVIQAGDTFTHSS